MRASLVLLLCAFLCLTQQAIAACTDGNNGKPVGADGCICKSGYVSNLHPVTKAFVSCVAGDSSTCVPLNTPLTQANNYPYLGQSSSFSSNTLNARLEGKFTNGRQFTSVSGGLADKCKLGYTGSYWSTSFDKNACEDDFILNLPWTSHSDCGFIKTSKVEVNEYVSTIQYTYEDALPSFSVGRISSGAVKIYVSFPKTVEISILSVVVDSVINFEAAITEDQFNPATSELKLELTTAIVWPNQLAGPASYSLLAGNSTLARPVQLAPVVCTGDANSVCTQKWTSYFTTSSCNFDGTYRLSFTVVTCRGDDATTTSCTRDTASVEYTISGSSICGRVTATAEAHGQLLDVSPTSHSTELSNAVHHLGEAGVFRADVTASGTPPASLTFRNIKLTRGTDTVTVYAVDGSTVDAAAAFGNVAVSSAVVSDTYFTVLFDSRLFTSVRPNGGPVTFKFTASLDVVFAGNNKRTVEVDLGEKVIGASVKFSLQAAEAEKQTAEESQPKSLTTLIGAVVGGVAGLAIISIGVAFLIIKLRKPQASSTSA